MSDMSKWPPSKDGQFTQAWINLDKLPGGMMQSYSAERGHFTYGPIPAFTSCAITTNPDDADRWRAQGKPVLTIYSVATPKKEAPSASGAGEAQELKPDEAIAWRATTPCYRQFITQRTYEGFSPAARRWYEPFRCASCATPTAGAPAAAVPSDPTDPGYDVGVLRDHVRALERRIRDLHRERLSAAPAVPAVQGLTPERIDAIAAQHWDRTEHGVKFNPQTFARALLAAQGHQEQQ